MPRAKRGGKEAYTSTELTHLGSKIAQDHGEEHNTRDHEYGIQLQRISSDGGRSSSSSRCWDWCQHQGGWLMASAHILTAIIGAGVLGLPHAMSWLGWVGGVIVLVLFFWITLWSSLLLADMYEVDGVKHPTYRSAVLHILGPWNAAAIVVFQYLNLILSSIGYTVAAGASMQMIGSGYCSRSSQDSTACETGGWRWSLVFGVVQLFFSQMPNLESAWWSSIIGAVMSILYSSCALGLGAANASNGLGSSTGRSAPPAQKAYGVFNAMGSIAFAYNFSAVLLEVQDTLHEPPKATHSMRKAVTGGLSVSFVFYMLVSIFGYMALGDAVPGDILTGFDGPYSVVVAANVMVLVHMVSAYQVFSQPVFHGFEEFARGCLPCWHRRPAWALRVLVRTLYVITTTAIACLMPFFTEIIGLVGALVFFPAAVYFPVRMYVKVRRPRRSIVIVMLVMCVVTGLVSVLAGVGAVKQIILDVSKFHIGGKRRLSRLAAL